MNWTPAFVYTDGDEVDVSLALPIGLWRHRDRSIGGEIESDAAYPAAYTVTTDYLLVLPLRFFEAEWPTVRALIEFGQTGGVIRWYPAAEDEETFFDVYLEDPAIGTDFQAIPDPAYPRALALPITVRRVDGEAFPLDYFPEAA